MINKWFLWQVQCPSLPDHTDINTRLHTHLKLCESYGLLQKGSNVVMPLFDVMLPQGFPKLFPPSGIKDHKQKVVQTLIGCQAS